MMYNMNLTKSLDKTKTAMIQAAEDAAVVFAFTLVTSLIALGWPPSLSTVYVPTLSAALIGVVTYAKARNIELLNRAIDSQDPHEES
jgi:hypothetical protein